MLEDKLHKEIKEYCKLNGLKMSDFINELVKKQFNIVKFGEKPTIFLKKVDNHNTNELDSKPISIEPKKSDIENKPEMINPNINNYKPIKTIKLK